MAFDLTQLQGLSTDDLCRLIQRAEQIIQSRLRADLDLPQQPEWEFISGHPDQPVAGLGQRPADPTTTSRAQAAGYQQPALLVPHLCPYRCAYCAERCSRNRANHGHHRCYHHRRM